MLGLVSLLLKTSFTFSLVCISVSLPTSVLFLAYDYKRKTIKVHERNKRSWEYLRSISHSEVPEPNKHLRMMLADPLLRNPIVYLRHRCCSDTMWDMTSCDDTDDVMTDHSANTWKYVFYYIYCKNESMTSSLLCHENELEPLTEVLTNLHIVNSHWYRTVPKYMTFKVWIDRLCCSSEYS